MKLFALSLIAAGSVEAKRMTILETHKAWWKGLIKNDEDNIRNNNPCRELETPDNADQVAMTFYEDANSKIKVDAEPICKPGYFPDFSNGSKRRTRCKAVKNKKTGEFTHQWIRPLAGCKTCTIEDPTARIKEGDDIDVFCTYNTKTTEKHCQMRCMDDRLRVHHNIIHPNGDKGKTQKRLNIDCRCKNGDCKWQSHGRRAPWLNRFKCVPHGELKDYTPTDCSLKKPGCTVVTPKVESLNSWVCRNCFRIRAYYKFNHFGIKDFDHQDYMDIKFEEPVIWIKHSHPVIKAEDVGNNTFRIRFSERATFANKEMDFSAEVRAATPAIPKIVVAKTCPCQA